MRPTPAQVAELLAGAEPTLLATDPPYGVELDNGWRDRAGVNRRAARAAGHATTTLASDSRARLEQGLHARALVAESLYVWHASRYACAVQAGLERGRVRGSPADHLEQGAVRAVAAALSLAARALPVRDPGWCRGAVVRAAEPVDRLERAEPEDGRRRTAAARATARSIILPRSRSCCTGARSRTTSSRAGSSTTRSAGAAPR